MKKNNLHEYKQSEEQQANSTIDRLQRDIGDLLGLYKQWKKKYAGLFDNIEQYFAITRFYEKLLYDLKDAKKEMKDVYDNAWEEESKLFRTLESGKNRAHLLNLRTKALRDMICNNSMCFESSNFDYEFKKVEDAALLNEYNEILRIYQDNGKWKELLAKDGSLLSDAESLALATIFLSLDNTDMAEFLRLCYGQKTPYNNSIRRATILDLDNIKAFSREDELENFNYCELDTMKINKLNQNMALLVSQGEIYVSEAVKIIKHSQVNISVIYRDENVDKREQVRDMYQKAGILQAISNIDTIASVDGTPSFTININKEDDDSGGEYVIGYTNYKKIAKSDWTGTVIGVKKYSAVVTRPHEGSANGIKLTNDKEKEFLARYDLPSNIAAICTDTFTGAIRDEIIEKGIDFVLTKEASKLGGPITFVVSMAIDGGTEYAEFIENMQREAYTIKGEKIADCATAFVLSCVYVEYTDEDIKTSVFIQPTPETQAFLDKYNNAAKQYGYAELKIKDVLYRPEYVFDYIGTLVQEHTDLYNDVFVLKENDNNQEK